MADPGDYMQKQTQILEQDRADEASAIPLDQENHDGEVMSSQDASPAGSLSRSASNSEMAGTTVGSALHAQAAQAAHNTAKKRKFACVECRQQKSKCDAHDRAPLPCTKCEKKGVPCVLKRDFRRTYKRAKNEAIEKRFKELTKTLTNLSSEEILRRIEREQQALLDNRNFTKDKVHHRRGKSIGPNGMPVNTASPGGTTFSPLSTVSYSSSDNNTSGNSNSHGNHEHHQRQREQMLRSSAYGNGSNASNSVNNQSGYVTCTSFSDGMTAEELECTPKSLGDIYMSSGDIAELFQEFALKYHQFLPVVNLRKGAESIYALSPCLFWVILLIGLRRRQNSSDLTKRLTILVKATLAEITISPIIRYTPSESDEPILNVASVYSVQAFLLYTFWPPLTSSLSADTSWNTIGTALFQAIRVGLNTADFSKEYANENSELIAEQKRTWICCNIVSQFIASSFGFPAYVSFDHLVMTSFKNGHSASVISDNYSSGSPNSTGAAAAAQANSHSQCAELTQMTQIAYFEHQMVNTMNSNPSNKLGMVNNIEKLPLLNILNQQLSELEINLESKHYMDNIRKFLLLVAKVHLLTYYFIDSDASNPFGGVSFETKCGLVKVYDAAINLLTHAYQMYESDPMLVKYFPGVFILNIWQTACVISKLVNSSLSESIDVERGKVAYQNAITLTYRASVVKHDMSYRSSGIMRSVWSLFSNMYEEWKEEAHEDHDQRSTPEFNLDITVKSRMSVSVFFDCLYILKEKCGMAKLAREKRQLADGVTVANNDSNGSAEDEEEDVEGGVNDQTQGNGIKSIEHPERRARRIIETIPLDPNPINAATIKSARDDLSSTATSPVLSEEQRNRLRTQSFRNQSGTPSLTGTPAMQGGAQHHPLTASNLIERDNVTFNGNTANGNSAPVAISTVQQLTEDRLNPLANEINELPLDESNIKLSYGGDNAAGDNAHIDANGNVQVPAESTSTNSKGSPNSIMANWDNWRSDMVFKDVDFLMNEFAFNPT